ncbi:MAG: hypothetical protein HOV81_40580 [Kofleriaceae bacterium]|nr:hypothetical protein [Kofleriaceae bacterium]
MEQEPEGATGFSVDALFPSTRDRVVVATLGCGTDERALSLPERQLLAEDDHEVVAQILDELRQDLAQTLGTVASQDDETRLIGAIANLRTEWEHLEAEQRRSIIDQVITKQRSSDPLVLAIRFVEDRTSGAIRDLSAATGQTPFPAAGMSWCAVSLSADDKPSLR